MPVVTWQIVNAPAGAVSWSGAFGRVNPDGSVEGLALSQEFASAQPLSTPLVFSNFVDVTGFWIFQVHDTLGGGVGEPKLKYVPAYGQNTVAVDGNFTLDWTAGGLSLLLLVGGAAVILGLVGIVATQGK